MAPKIQPRHRLPKTSASGAQEKRDQPRHHRAEQGAARERRPHRWGHLLERLRGVNPGPVQGRDHRQGKVAGRRVRRIRALSAFMIIFIPDSQFPSSHVLVIFILPVLIIVFISLIVLIFMDVLIFISHNSIGNVPKTALSVCSCPPDTCEPTVLASPRSFIHHHQHHDHQQQQQQYQQRPF